MRRIISGGGLPGRHGTVRVEDAGHGTGACEPVPGHLLFVQIEAEAWLGGQGILAVDQAHGGEAEPLLPDLLLDAGFDAGADLLHEEVRHGGVDMDAGNAAAMVDIGLDDIDG